MTDVQAETGKNRDALYYRSQRRALERIRQQQQDNRYDRRRTQVVGSYAGAGQVIVSGGRYQLEERGLSLQSGDTIIVENAGRPGAAIYVPVPQANEV